MNEQPASLWARLAALGSKTVAEFCWAEKISRSQYYTMKREGWGPDEAWIGRLVRITDESHWRWQRQRERAAELGIRGPLPAHEVEALRHVLPAYLVAALRGAPSACEQPP